MDDQVDIDTIYMETVDPESNEFINVLFDKKRLVNTLVRDYTVDWANLLLNWRTRLIEYIRDNITLDTHTLELNVRNKADLTNMLVNQC